MNKTLSIIGSGWLATHFLNEYHHLFTSIVTTSVNSSAHPNSNHHFFLNIYNKSQIDLPKTDICLVTVPFSRKLEHPEVYFSALSNLLCIPNKYEKIIFTSSTSIYEATNALANEDAKLNQSKRAIA